MSFHAYDDASGEFIDLDDASIGHEDHEEPLVEFGLTNNPNQVQIMFNLDKVRIHTLSDGDVIVTLKT